MKCQLTNKISVVGKKVAKVRKFVTGRTSRNFHPNIQVAHFKTPELGALKMRIATRTKKTIDKYGGLVEYLLNISENQLSDYGLKLKGKLLK
jgi:ribosomal protein L28